MTDARQKVQKYIESNFELEKFTVKEWSLLPGGVILEDSNNDRILVFYDIMKDKVMYDFD